MQKINTLLRKCKSLSRQLGRTSSYSSLRSKSTRERFWSINDDECHEVVFVGRSRKPYVVKSRHLTHPVLNALIERSNQKKTHDGMKGDIYVKCEVVLFDHLLWMLENANASFCSDESLEELAEWYVYWFLFSLHIKTMLKQLICSLLCLSKVFISNILKQILFWWCSQSVWSVFLILFIWKESEGVFGSTKLEFYGKLYIFLPYQRN